VKKYTVALVGPRWVHISHASQKKVTLKLYKTDKNRNKTPTHLPTPTPRAHTPHSPRHRITQPGRKQLICLQIEALTYTYMFTNKQQQHKQ
jgi:hypothetical protein